MFLYYIMTFNDAFLSKSLFLKGLLLTLLHLLHYYIIITLLYVCNHKITYDNLGFYNYRQFTLFIYNIKCNILFLLYYKCYKIICF